MTTTKKKRPFFLPHQLLPFMSADDLFKQYQNNTASAACAFMLNLHLSAWGFCFLLHLLQRAELGQANTFSTGTPFPIQRDIQNPEVMGTITGVRDSNTSYKLCFKPREVHKLSEVPCARSPELVQWSTFFFFKLGLKEMPKHIVSQKAERRATYWLCIRVLWKRRGGISVLKQVLPPQTSSLQKAERL